MHSRILLSVYFGNPLTIPYLNVETYKILQENKECDFIETDKHTDSELIKGILNSLQSYSEIILFLDFQYPPIDPHQNLHLLLRNLVNFKSMIHTVKILGSPGMYQAYINALISKGN